MQRSLVSVIVTTKNSEKTLHKCLSSVVNQLYKPIELIVVDNFSNDHTVEIAKKFTGYIYIEGTERSEQRNIGIQHATGEYLLFLDSDMYLSKSVVSECVETIIKYSSKGIYIPERIEGDSYWEKVRDFERSFYNNTVIDAVRFVTKRDAERIKGFDTTLFAGEDWDFDKRMRKLGSTHIITSPLYHNEENFNLIQYIKKKAYYSPNLDIYREKWKNDSEVYKQFSIMYRYITVFTEQNKWKRLLVHLDLAFGMYLLRLLVGLTYLLHKKT